MPSLNLVTLENLPDPGSRYLLDKCLYQGAFFKTFRAQDTQETKSVAVKIQNLNSVTDKYVKNEYDVLKKFSSHDQLISFYGAYKNDSDIWFILELCEGGTVIDLVTRLISKNRKLPEEHIAYILKETTKGVTYLHASNILHRNLQAANIFFTRDGEIKLGGLSYAKCLNETLEKTGTSLGSPCWMAPETITAKQSNDQFHYDCRCDVWSLGIVAIELGDGKAPYQNMHPSRALFQIVRNPPPTLYRQSNWTGEYNDFINECLVKNPEHRPFMEEILEHPFLGQIPENYHHLTLEIKSYLENADLMDIPTEERSDVFVFETKMKTEEDSQLKNIDVEDLATLDNINDKVILEELYLRAKNGNFQTFVGDILVTLNPNQLDDINFELRKKYQLKSRSDNQPHIYAIADSAYQNALHHNFVQKIVLAGESGSGKTVNYLNLIDHLLFLGENSNVNLERVKRGISLIHALVNASTPLNDHSTRCILTTEVTYGATGKCSGAQFKVTQLEKTRISAVDMCHGNFHVFYYLYDGLNATNQLEEFKLCPGRQLRYLRIIEDSQDNQPRTNIAENVTTFKNLQKILREFEFNEEQQKTIWSVLSAILIIGEIRFEENEENLCQIINEEPALDAANLLDLDQKQFCWALTNYCLLKDGVVVKRRNTCDEARNARDVLANNLYARIVDYIVSYLNHKLALGQLIFGDKYAVQLYDYFGFECFSRNDLPQLLINTYNEQIQHHFVQRVFKWETVDVEQEEIDREKFSYYDNNIVLDQLLHKTEGIFSSIDQASRMDYSGKYIIDFIQNQENEHVSVTKPNEFSVAHYTGKVYYNSNEMPDKNRDFLPPEVTEALRRSNNPIVKMLFTNKLDKTGNLIIEFDDIEIITRNCLRYASKKTGSNNRYSQSKKMRTLSAVFRAASLQTLMDLSVGAGSGGTHFVRCVRTNLNNKPGCINQELIRQQLKALTVTETAKARSYGFAHRIPFHEFLQRYKFLAYSYDEPVDFTRDNCRLLLIRLKMEGWALGKFKVFLKYYHEEYLARLYETQVKKIIKIQSILRRFLTKCRLKNNKQDSGPHLPRRRPTLLTEEEAAVIIQHAYRRRLQSQPSIDVQTLNLNGIDSEQSQFIRPFALKWKKKSIYQVLMQHKSLKFLETFNFCQQVHIYNSNAFCSCSKINDHVDLSKIDTSAQVTSWMGKFKPRIMKINFNLNEIPFYDTSGICNEKILSSFCKNDLDCWDSPYSWRMSKVNTSPTNKAPLQRDLHPKLINLPYNRSSEEEFNKLPEDDFKEVTELTPIKTQSPSPVLSPKAVKNAENEKLQNGQTDIPILKPIPKIIPKNDTNYDSKPANQDFDYVKPPFVKLKHRTADPVTELKNIARRNSSSSDDNPPFNFQGMLRKTNFQRESIKRGVEGFRRLSLKISNEDSNTKVENGMNNSVCTGKHISTELIPGLIIEGIEFDL